MLSFRDMPIGRKLTLLMALTSSVTVTLACVGFCVYNYQSYRSMLVRDTQALAQIIGASSEPALDFANPSDASRTLLALDPRKRILGARLFDREGKVLSSYRRGDAGRVELPETAGGGGHQVSNGRLILFHPVVRDNDLLGTVCLVADLKSELARYFWVTTLIFAALLVVVVVVTALVSAKAQSVVSAPILELAEVARGVAEDKDYRLRASKQGDDETGMLVDTFNEMLDRIEQREEELESTNRALEEQRQKLQDQLSERERAEQALRASEERFRQIAESINEVFWVADIKQNQFIYISPAYQKVWGRSCASAYANAKSAVEAIHPDDMARVRESVKAPNPDGSVEAVYRVVHPDGAIRWVRDRAFTVTDDEGKPYRIVGIAEDITEQRQAAQALRESEQRYRELVETASDVIFVVGADTKLMALNPAFEIVTGRKVEDWVGKSFAPLVHPDDLPLAMRYFERTLRGEKMPAFELRVCAITGEYLTAEFTTSPQVHEGKVVGALGIGRDISERKRAEVRLAQSEAKFRKLAETVAAGTFIYREDRMVYVNPAAVKMTGYSEAELLTKNFLDLIHPDDRTTMQERGRARTQGEPGHAPFEVKILTKAGGARWVAFAAGAIEFEGKPAVLGTAFDITERKEAEEQLRRLQQEQQAILDLVPAFIWYKDCHNRILRLNRGAAESIGKTVAEIEGRQTEEFYPDDAAKYYADDLEVIRSGKPRFGIVEELLTASGEKRWVQTDKVPMRDDSGKVVGVIVYAMDITERKKTDEMLRLQAQVLENMAEGVCVADEKGVVIFANRALEEMYGYERGELLGKPVATLRRSTAESEQQQSSIIQTMRERGLWKGEIESVRKDGTTFLTHNHITTLKLSGRDCWVCVKHDVTEQRRAEQALRDAEEKWRSLTENSRDIIIIVDERGDILYVNRVLSGFDKSKVIGSNSLDYVSADNRETHRRALQAVFERGESQQFEVQGAGADGTVAWYESRLVPITHAGRVISAMLISSDITERKRLEKQVLEISEREQQRIGQDLHDGLCQHLVGTSLAAQLLAEKLESRRSTLAADAHGIAELIGEAITHSRRIARGLYPVQLEESGLMSALSELATTVSELFYVRCKFRCDRPVLLPATAASIHLYRIAQEAVNNAINHGKAKNITIGLEQSGAEIVLAISDDGVGLPERGGKQAGMGLRIMAYRAQLLDGEFSIGPRPEGGTQVRCRVPIPSPHGATRHAN